MTLAHDVVWLDDGEQQAWLAFLSAKRLLFSALESQLQAESGMPLAYYEILVTLSESTGRTLRVGVLAARLHSSSSRISHALTKLEACGWLCREADPADRRAQLAVLTDEGMAALVAAAPGHVAAVRRHLLDPLTREQVQQLASISGAIAGALGATDEGSRADR